jgi:capsid protein
MSQQIPIAFVNQYHGDVEMLLQQKGSRLRPCVRVEDQKGEIQFWEQIGPTEAVDITNRHGDSPQVDSDHFRRAVTLQFFDWGDFIDKIDKVRMLIDPTNSYTQNAVYALGRKIDRIIVASFFATAKSGHDGSGAATFPAGQQVAINLGGTNVGLTVPKLVRSKKILLAGEVDMDEPLYLAYAAQQMEDLLNLTQVTSADYNSVKALVRGDVNSFMGYEFVHTELITKVSTTRSVPVWAKSGVLCAISPDVETAVERRWDKRGNVYVYAAAGAGSTRMQEPKVVQIDCLEA